MIPEPRLATTMCVLAPGDGGIRVLMVRRSAAMRFMPGAWVFPVA
jgi:8-oxo-dGTP pyrophosphatase MutT (NUDIX family)